MGLTYDGENLLLPSRDQSVLYRIDFEDPRNYSEITLPTTLGNDITWHNGYFWSVASGKGLGKFEINGNQATIVGSIYPVAYDAWAITSNGEVGGKMHVFGHYKRPVSSGMMTNSLRSNPCFRLSRSIWGVIPPPFKFH